MGGSPVVAVVSVLTTATVIQAMATTVTMGLIVILETVATAWIGETTMAAMVVIDVQTEGETSTTSEMADTYLRHRHRRSKAVMAAAASTTAEVTATALLPRLRLMAWIEDVGVTDM